VMMMSSNEMPSFAQDDAIEPLDDLIARDNVNLEEIFYPTDVTARRFEGKTYMIPHTVASGQNLLFLNNAVFAEVGLDPTVPPQTWADLEAYADKIVVRSG